MATRNIEELIQQAVRRDDILVDDQGQLRTVKRAIVTATAAGDNTIVAAVTGLKIRTLALVLVTKAALDVRFRSNGADISPIYGLGAGGGLVLPHNTFGWMEGAAGGLVAANLSGAGTVGITMLYCEVP